MSKKLNKKTHCYGKDAPLVLINDGLAEKNANLRKYYFSALNEITILCLVWELYTFDN